MVSETFSQEYAPKQLSMTLAEEEMRQVAEPRVPGGYALRGYRPGDEKGWSELLLLCGFDEWGRDLTTDEYLRDPERREGSRVVVRSEQIVAATFASRQDTPVRAGVLDYVVSHPDHRNQGLGRAVCADVVGFFAGRGYDSVTLLTDDWRLPAIKVYLWLGFEPQMTRDDMPGRWAAVMGKLAEPRPEGRQS